MCFIGIRSRIMVHKDEDKTKIAESHNYFVVLTLQAIGAIGVSVLQGHDEQAK